MSQMEPNLERIQAVLRRIDREVWVITAADGVRRSGLTATWILPASIDPERPMLLAGLAANHFTAELVQASGVFAAHLLRADQLELAWNFASDSGRGRDKLSGLKWEPSESGAPILADCLAWCDCRVISSCDAGDRWLFWADVIAAWQVSAGEPLREQHFFRNLTSEQRQKLLADRDADVMIQRPLHAGWRESQAPLSLHPAANHNQS